MFSDNDLCIAGTTKRGFIHGNYETISYHRPIYTANSQEEVAVVKDLCADHSWPRTTVRSNVKDQTAKYLTALPHHRPILM